MFFVVLITFQKHIQCLWLSNGLNEVTSKFAPMWQNLLIYNKEDTHNEYWNHQVNRYDNIQIQIVYTIQHHQNYRSCMKAIYSTTTPTIVLCTPYIFQTLLFFRHTKKNIFIAGGAYQSSMQKNCRTTNLVFVKLTLGVIFSSIRSMRLVIFLKCTNIRNLSSLLICM